MKKFPIPQDIKDALDIDSCEVTFSKYEAYRITSPDFSVSLKCNSDDTKWLAVDFTDCSLTESNWTFFYEEFGEENKLLCLSIRGQISQAFQIRRFYYKLGIEIELLHNTFKSLMTPTAHEKIQWSNELQRTRSKAAKNI